MLVLTRKLGESIVIDDEIVLTVTSVQGSRVKLSLDAPKSRRIMRGEIAGAVQTPATAPEPKSWNSGGAEPRETPPATLSGAS
jgi:carbon storage regulator